MYTTKWITEKFLRVLGIQLNFSSKSSSFDFTSESIFEDMPLVFSTSSNVTVTVGWDHEWDPEGVFFEIDIIGVYFALSDGQDFLEDHVSVVSATRVGNGGASANGVNRSEGEEIANIALAWLIILSCNVIVVRSSFSNIRSINHLSPKSLEGPAFLRGLGCLVWEVDRTTSSGALSN